MDTIAKHFKRLTAKFEQRQNSAEIVSSAKKLAELVLRSDDLHMRHRKKMLKEILWWISEADGKYTTRYRSKAVVELATLDPNSTEKVNHEHVNPRATVADRLLKDRQDLLKNPAKLHSILEEAVGCVVLASEHRKLNDKAVGWKRYAQVPVLDMSTTPPTEVVTDAPRLN